MSDRTDESKKNDRQKHQPNRMTVQNRRSENLSEFTLIEAAGGGRPKVAGIAYSGGKMTLPGWKHPVVVDLAGMEIPATVPLLTNHENKTDARVGMISASVKDNALEITGEIVSEN